MTPRTLRIALTIENALKSAPRPWAGGMGHWYGLVQAETPGADYGGVLTALKHLWQSGVIALTKRDGSYDALEYSGDESTDHWFFFEHSDFNVRLRSAW
jgi:hypothetical protein